MSSCPRILLITQDMPAFAPVMTAKFRACTKGPPAKAYINQYHVNLDANNLMKIIRRNKHGLHSQPTVITM